MRILIIDDSNDKVEDIKDYLKEYTKDFTVCNTGVKGLRSIAYPFIFMLISGTTLLVTVRYYLKTKGESRKIKYYVVYGYLLFYLWNTMITKSSLTTIYIYPILLLSLMYFHRKIINIIAVASILINIAGVTQMILVQNKTAPLDITDYEIQLLGNVIILGVTIVSGKFIRDTMDTNMKSIVEKASEQEEIANRLKAVGTVVSNLVDDTTAKMKSVNDNTNVAVNSLEEVSRSINLITENIQDQTYMTQKYVSI